MNNQQTQFNQKFPENSIIYFNRDPYFLVRQIKKTYFENIDDIKYFQNFIHADIVKQNNEYYFFVRDVPSVEFEDIIENDIIENDIIENEKEINY